VKNVLARGRVIGMMGFSWRCAIIGERRLDNMKKRAIAFCAVLFAVAGWARAGVFKPEEIPKDLPFPGDVGGWIYVWSESPRLLVTKEPTYPNKAYYGGLMQRNGRHEILAVAYATKKGGNLDRLILDLNRNKDLTDDPVLKPKEEKALPIEFTQADGSKLPALIHEVGVQTEMMQAQVRPREWLRGKIELGDKTYDAVLIDQGLDGVSLGVESEDLLVLDRNGDGKFELAALGPLHESFSYVKGTMLLEGRVWLAKWNSEAMELKLEPYNMPVGRIQLQIDPDSDLKTARAAVLLRSSGFALLGIPSVNFSTSLHSASEPFEVPALNYQYTQTVLSRILPDGKREIIVVSSLPQAIPRIAADQTFNLKIGKPTNFEIQAFASGGQLRVKKSKVVGGDVEYTNFTIVRADGVGEQAPPPKVFVYLIKDGKETLVAEGNMEYG
jgi:hypothetical protein